MTKLYIMDISPLCGEELFTRSLELVSGERREKALGFLRRRDAALSVGAELLLRYALIRDFRVKKLPEISLAVRGKPYFKNPQGLYFSLSHSGDYVACLASDENEVGVDIQQVQSARMPAAKRVLSEKAYARLEAVEERDRDGLFFELWVLHESAVKLKGGSVFDSINCDGSRLVDAPEGYRIAVAIGV